MSKTDAQLISELEINEERAEWGAWAVVVGLVIEIILALAVSFGLDNKVVESWGAVAADSLIALGVYCEIHFGRKASSGSGELRKRSAEKAAEAIERAAIIEKENAGRRISKEQHDVLVKSLSEQPSTFDINTTGDGEAGLFAADIVKTLADAGWSVREKYFPLGMSWQNLNVSFSADPASTRLLTAFQTAGIEVSWFTEKGQGDVPTIWVGSKPPPF